MTREINPAMRTKPASQRVPTPDIKEKVDALMAFLGTPNITDFANAIGMGRQTIDDSIRDGGLTKRTASMFEDKLREVGVTFSSSWSEWREAAQNRADPAADFDAKLRDTNPNFDHAAFERPRESRCRPVLSGAPEGAPGKLERNPVGRANRNPSQPIRECDPGPDPEATNLVTMRLFSGQTEGNSTGISVRISVGADNVPDTGADMTVAMGQLEIDCGAAKADLTSIRGVNDQPYTVTNRIGRAAHGSTSKEHVVKVRPDRLDERAVRWRLRADGVTLGTVNFEEAILVRVTGLAPGDEIVGTFGTWMKNVTSSIAPPSIRFVDDMGEEIAVEGPQLTALQERAIERLQKKGAALEVDEDNYATLARHRLVFERKDD